MKKLLTKRNVLIATLVGVTLLLALFVGVRTESCYQSVICHNAITDNIIVGILFVCFFAFLLLPFSLITYKMRDEVFEHWIAFAKWGVPALMILTYLILGGGSRGGLGIESAYGGTFDALLLVLLYGIFCLVSIWRIASKHRELTHRGK